MDPHIEEIKKVFPNAKIEFCDSKFKIRLLDSTNIIMLYDSNLQRFRKKLEKMLKTHENAECEVCFESFKYSYSIFCDECYNYVCMACYNKIRIKGKGTFTCPYCRHKKGKTYRNDMKLLIKLCKCDLTVFRNRSVPDNIIPAILIYIKYLDHEKKYIFNSGGIFKEFDGRRSDECDLDPYNLIKFHDELLPFFKGNPVFEKVTENNN